MTKRKPVLVLFIITAIFFVAGAVFFLLPTVFNPASPEVAVSFADLNKGIIDAYAQGSIAMYVSLGLEVVLFILIPLIVHLKRKQHSVTVILLLGALLALYLNQIFVGYMMAKLPYFQSILNDQAAMEKAVSQLLLMFLGLGLFAFGTLMEFVTFIVDMCIRAKEPQVLQTAAEMREEPKEEPAPAPAPAEEPKAEEPQEEPAKEEAPEAEMEEEPKEEVKEEPKAEPKEEPKQTVININVVGAQTAEAEEKKAPAKKAPAKKEAAKKEPAKKAPAKKAEPKKEPAKKAPAKKAEPKRATQTIKKADVLTNEEGKQFAKAYHISQRKELNKWQVKGAGSDKALKLFDTQKEAIEYANQLSANNGAAVRVHSRAGKMRKA